MARYRISGIWKDSDGVITHYAFHRVISDKEMGYAVKKTKAEAIALLDKAKGNSAVTWLWDYQNSFWKIGNTVEVVEGSKGKYLRSNPDNSRTDNLGHLIDFDWITFQI